MKATSKRLETAHTLFYRRQRDNFNKELLAQWSDLVEHCREVVLPEASTPSLELILDRPPQAVQLGNNCYNYTKKAGMFITTGIVTAMFTAPMIYNAATTLDADSSHPSALYWTAAIGLTAIPIYNGMSLINRFCHNTWNALRRVVFCQRQDSLIYQFRPGQTLLSIALSVVPAVLSYAVVDKMFEHMWPSDPIAPWDKTPQAITRGIERASINIYHVIGCLEIMKKMITHYMVYRGTDREKYFAKLETIIHYLTLEMPQSEFIGEMEKLSQATRASLRVTTWDEMLSRVQQANNMAEKKSLLREVGLERFSAQINKRVGGLQAHSIFTKSPQQVVVPTAPILDRLVGEGIPQRNIS